jgi:alanine-synthesizing transaminase
VPIGEGRNFVHDLERAVKHSIPSPIAVVVNFPSNPTAMTADLAFYDDVIGYCKKRGIYVISDIAYAELYYDIAPPPSALEIPGAKDICIEFTSLSKTYAMPGWRIGFATGNRKLIAALARVKSYLDYGAFTPIQVAATAALNGPQACVAEIRDTYKKRRDVLVESFAAAGWTIPPPPASMFAWAPIPPAYHNAGALEFSKLLLKEAKVAVSPGVGFGEWGEGFVRLALVENPHRIRQAARNIKRFLSAEHAPAAAEKQLAPS